MRKIWEFIGNASQSRTTALLVVLVIAAAIPLTALVAQRQQNFQQKADSSYCYGQTNPNFCTAANGCQWSESASIPPGQPYGGGATSGGCIPSSSSATAPVAPAAPATSQPIYTCEGNQICVTSNGSKICNACTNGSTCTMTAGTPTCAGGSTTTTDNCTSSGYTPCSAAQAGQNQCGSAGTMQTCAPLGSSYCWANTGNPCAGSTTTVTPSTSAPTFVSPGYTPGCNSITLNWGPPSTGVTSSTSYVIAKYSSAGGDINSNDLPLYKTSATSYTITGLNSNPLTAYYFNVWATNGEKIIGTTPKLSILATTGACNGTGTGTTTTPSTGTGSTGTGTTTASGCNPACTSGQVCGADNQCHTSIDPKQCSITNLGCDFNTNTSCLPNLKSDSNCFNKFTAFAICTGNTSAAANQQAQSVCGTTGTTTTTTASAFKRADVDHDGDVDIQDYNILIGCMTGFISYNSNTCGSFATNADIDKNGTVDQKDYNAWLRLYKGIDAN